MSKQFVTTNVDVGKFWGDNGKYAMTVGEELACAAKMLHTTSQIYCYNAIKEDSNCVVVEEAERWMTVSATKPEEWICRIEYRGMFYSIN